jgi:hypothetical protein
MALLFTLFRDYMQQLTDETNLLLKEINSRRAAGGGDDIEEKLDTACFRVTGLSLKSVRASSPEILCEMINPLGQMAPRSLLAADILCLDAEIQQEKGYLVNAVRSQLQAFALLVEAIPSVPENDQARYRPKLDSLYSALIAIDDPYLREKLGTYQPVTPQ